jgi:hypothetical protein
MFASVDPTAQATPRVPPLLAARVRPLSAAADRLVPVLGALAPLLFDRALRRGTTTVVAGPPGSGATTLALALLVAPTAAGHWAAVVGLGSPGVVAMAELGVDLGRTAFSPRPRAGWAEAVATLLDGVDLVVVRPPGRVRPTAARRLAARARERQGVLVVLVERVADWPGGSDLQLCPEPGEWQGAGQGHGRLEGRPAEVRATGRRAAGPVARCSLWLPSATGTVVEALPSHRRPGAP